MAGEKYYVVSTVLCSSEIVSLLDIGLVKITEVANRNP